VLQPNELPVRINRDAAVTALVYAATTPKLDAALILAHGAGAGQQSAFMTSFARALAGLGADTITFNFLYTEQQRRIPDRRPALEACYAAVIHAGLAESPRGLVLLGYPLHPPGRPDDRRDSHLPDVKCPMLFVQGSRDTFGTPTELEPVMKTLHSPAELHVVAGGDHSFKVSSDARRQAPVFDEVQRKIVSWRRGVIGRRA
jgi:uncharacterized protein